MTINVLQSERLSLAWPLLTQCPFAPLLMAKQQQQLQQASSTVGSGRVNGYARIQRIHENDCQQHPENENQSAHVDMIGALCGTVRSMSFYWPMTYARCTLA